MLSKGHANIKNYKTVSEGAVLSYYLGITHIPTLIQNPLRKDTHPSLGFYSFDGKRVFYKDFATGDKGGVFDFLQKLWNCSYADVISRIVKDIPNTEIGIKKSTEKVRIFKTNQWF